MEKFIMKLRKVSTHSYAVTVPKEIIKELNWRERQKIDISFDRKKKEIKLKDWKKR